MPQELTLNQNYVQSGLGSVTFTIPADGQYNVRAEISCPQSSGLTVVINKNSSEIYRAPLIAPPNQSSEQLKFSFQAEEDDSIEIVLDSSEDVDDPKNVIKAVLSIGEGL